MRGDEIVPENRRSHEVGDVTFEPSILRVSPKENVS